MTAPFPPCPRCGSTNAVPIEYGYPSAELFEASQRGEIVLGGCVIGFESPDYECRECDRPLPWVARDPDDDVAPGAGAPPAALRLS